VSDGPLSVLAGKLRSLGIPSLSVLIARLEGAEEYEAFVALVRKFLPEREGDILLQTTPQAQVAAFASDFQVRYFPLDYRFEIGDIEGYGELTWRIPVIPRGLSYDDYHWIASEWREGFQLMTYLVESPFGEERAALAEACEDCVPGYLLQQVPEQGFSPRELEHLLEGTKFIGLLHWANMVWHETGNFFLDIDYEELWSAPLEWDRGTVDWLTPQWHGAERIEEEVCNLAEWLEGDPPARFGELLNFILERRSHG